jgi:hypothetical protein
MGYIKPYCRHTRSQTVLGLKRINIVEDVKSKYCWLFGARMVGIGTQCQLLSLHVRTVPIITETYVSTSNWSDDNSVVEG